MSLPRIESPARNSENSSKPPRSRGLAYKSRNRPLTGLSASPPATIVRSQETHRLTELGTRSEHRQSVTWDNSQEKRRMLSSPNLVNLQTNGTIWSRNYRPPLSAPAPGIPKAHEGKETQNTYGNVSVSQRRSTTRPSAEQNGQRESWSRTPNNRTSRGRSRTQRDPAHLFPSRPPSVQQPSSVNSTGTSRKGGTSLKSKVRKGTNAFSRLWWHGFSKGIFLQSTKLVDKTTEVLVKASRKFHKVPVELRELSITMAVLDHSLIEYAQKVRKQTRRSETPGTSNLITPINSWRHPGGLVSFSEILSRTLKSACTILQNMEHYSTFWGFLHVFKMIWILPVLFVFASVRLEAETYSMIVTLKMLSVNLTKLILDFVRKELYPALPASATLTKLSFRFLLSVSTWIHKVYVFLTTRVGKHINAHLVASKSRFLFLMLGLYLTYKRIQCWHRSKLKEVNIRLNKLLQYWQLCMSSIDERKNRLDRDLEYRTLSDSFEASYERWTLGLVAPNSNIRSCFWYNVNFKMKLMKLSVDVTYATLSRYWEIFGPRLNFFPLGMGIFTYYCLRPQAAELRSNQLLAKPDLRLILFVWQALDGSFARWITLSVMPRLGMARSIPVLLRINIPGTVEKNDKFEASLTKDVEWFNSNSSEILGSTNSLQTTETDQSQRRLGNRVPGENVDEMSSPNTTIDVPSGLEGSSQRSGNVESQMLTRTPILLLSASKVDEISKAAPCSIWWPSRQSATVHPARPLKTMLKQRNVVFFVHGGAFLTNFCASDMRFLSIWAHQVQSPVVSVDYRLSPASSFPSPLVDCYNAYRYIVKGGLGFKVRRIVVVGDSNGCLLAVALTLKIMQDENHTDPEHRLMKPSQVILSCPVLNLRPCPTTSRLLFMMDPLVSHNMFHQFRKLYLPSTESYETNYYVSPLVAAPDRLLRKFPPCGIVCGGFDPFCDDAVDWAHRLHDNGVKVMFERFECLPHMFLAFGHIFPEAEQAIKICGTWMRQAFGMRPAENAL